VQSNRALRELLGYSEGELRATTVHELTHPDDRRVSLELFSDLVAGRRQHYELEKRYVHKTGHVVWGHLTVSPVRRPDGSVRFVLGMIADMRERKELEERLRHAEKMEAVGKLAGGVAHEFNNLLAIMQHYTRFVADELPRGPAREDLEEVMKAGGRAAELVRQLLTFSRREDAAAVVHDVNAVVSEITMLLRSVLGEDIVLVKRLAAEALPARIDPGQMEQVLMNLAFNARDAMPGGGRLTIESRAVSLSEDELPDLAPGSYVSLTVADTGIGMTDEVAARVFEPFFTTKRRGEGTGLGLATVYGIVKQSGGTISVTSNEGRGATFTILMPMAEEVHDEGPVVVQPGAARGAGQRVLVVEDESRVRNAVHRILAGNGYEVETAASGAEALEMLARSPDAVDALVTDVVMPGMSGPELSERVRTVRGPLPTVFISGYADDLLARHGAAEGSRCLRKPFTVEELLDEVRLVLPRRDVDPVRGAAGR
jgi:two-component system, cell cycle sensor histidine kinase and response regulator CckA